MANTKSVVRRNRRKPDKVEVETLGIMTANYFVDLWLRWQDGEISAGLKGQPAFIVYKDPQPHPINHIAVCTGWGSVGHWKIAGVRREGMWPLFREAGAQCSVLCGKMEWKTTCRRELVSPVIYRSLSVKPIEGGTLHWVNKGEKDPIPDDAFIGGHENGEVLYIARALHIGGMTPGKYMPSQGCAIILCGYNASWVETKGNLIPPHAFAAGYAADRNIEPVFIGRGHVKSHLIPGKVHTHSKMCYLPYKNKEVLRHRFDILVVPDQLPDAVVWRTKTPNEHRPLVSRPQVLAVLR